MSIDTATCDDCLAEVLDPHDRRHRYPFTNCTNCGPRYTIVLQVPYDRPATTMAGFAMCPDCLAEYHDPGNRRFHAQPNACPVCGPQLAWRDLASGVRSTSGEALAAAVVALRAGRVAGVKGIGGYHLAVDATDSQAVAELRRRKARDDKPFAVMVADLGAAEAVVELSPEAAELLSSPRRPIVLARRRANAIVADAVAPGLPELGLMLPYTPLHHLLLADVGRPLVMTSGNLSDEPIAHEDDDAATRLAPLVDGLLSHDRPIHIRCDDSVVRGSGRRSQVLRRSRGYAPEPLAAALRARLLGARPRGRAEEHDRRDEGLDGRARPPPRRPRAPRDLHRRSSRRSTICPRSTASPPASSRTTSILSTCRRSTRPSSSYPTIGVQHHHAHVAACMVEHGRIDPVVGLTFDGLGYGTDGTMWGGEVLVADFGGFERVAHLRAAPMPGGVAAIREPWRMAAVWAMHAGLDPAGLLPAIDPAKLGAVVALAERPGVVTTTSVGRLFDAVAVLLGGRSHVTYEAQAAIELEALARTATRARAASDELVVDDGGVLDPAPLVAALARERAAGGDAAVIGGVVPRVVRDRSGQARSAGRIRRGSRRRRADGRCLPERVAHGGRRVSPHRRGDQSPRPLRRPAERRGDQRRAGRDRRLGVPRPGDRSDAPPRWVRVRTRCVDVRSPLSSNSSGRRCRYLAASIGSASPPDSITRHGARNGQRPQTSGAGVAATSDVRARSSPAPHGRSARRRDGSRRARDAPMCGGPRGLPRDGRSRRDDRMRRRGSAPLGSWGCGAGWCVGRPTCHVDRARRRPGEAERARHRQ